MKTREMIFYLIILLSLSSCAHPFYQIYKTTTSENLVRKNNNLVYEDDNCMVSYNLWSDGGDIGFRFYNKTTSDIYLKLGESFFVFNQTAHKFFDYRTYSISRIANKRAEENAGLSEKTVGRNHIDLFKTEKTAQNKALDSKLLSNSSISYFIEETVCIPAKTSRTINECRINESVYRDCDLNRQAQKKEIKTKVFLKEESPFVFSNILAYTIGKTDDLIQIKNDFYVSEITNYPENEIMERKAEQFCGEKEGIKREYFKKTSPDSFYIKYTKAEKSFRKH